MTRYWGRAQDTSSYQLFIILKMFGGGGRGGARVPRAPSPVLAPFFLRSSLRSGGLAPRGKKMGPTLIACARASFNTKNLLKDLE